MTRSPGLPLALATTVFASTPSHPHPGRRTLPVPQQPGLSRLRRSFCRRATTPANTLAFENDLRLLLDECGRQILQTVFSFAPDPRIPRTPPSIRHLPRPPGLRPQGPEKPQPGRHRPPCSAPSNSSVVCTNRHLGGLMMTNRPLRPLELALGIVAKNATPALAERVGRLTGQRTQEELRTLLQRDPSRSRLVGHRAAPGNGGSQRVSIAPICVRYNGKRCWAGS